MNLTALMRLACWMSALAALAGTVPATAEAWAWTPGTARVAIKGSPLIFGTVPVPAKGSDAPVVTKKLSPVPDTDNALPLSAASKTSSAPIAEKERPATRHSSVPMIKKASFVPVAAITPPLSYLVPEGESRVYRFARPIKRVAIANPNVADYIIINPTELYLLGKKAGATNLVIWDQNGNFTSAPLYVNRNTKPIETLLKLALPHETEIEVYSLGPALILEGTVSDAIAAEKVYRLVIAYSGGTPGGFTPEATFTNSSDKSDSQNDADNGKPDNGKFDIGKPDTGKSDNGKSDAGESDTIIPGAKRVVSTGIKGTGVVNLLKIRDQQQVRLEVHIAEVSRSYIESLGLGFFKGRGSNGGGLMTGFVSNATLNLLLNTAWDPNLKEYVNNNLRVEAERKNSLVKILAEPTIIAMSGHEGQFHAGGTVYLQTIDPNDENKIVFVKEYYGVLLKFIPTVLDGGRILLTLMSQISEPNTEPVTAGTSLNLPSFKISSAQTTAQMNEGENLVIGGLLKDNITNNITAVPLLGDLPLLGTLFRRTEKNVETKELLIVVRPTLVKASATMPELPTDKFVPPSSGELFINGKLEGSRNK